MTKAKITPIRREILDEIRRNGRMTTRQLQEAFPHIDRKELSGHIRYLSGRAMRRVTSADEYKPVWEVL